MFSTLVIVGYFCILTEPRLLVKRQFGPPPGHSLTNKHQSSDAPIENIKSNTIISSENVADLRDSFTFSPSMINKEDASQPNTLSKIASIPVPSMHVEDISIKTISESSKNSMAKSITDIKHDSNPDPALSDAASIPLLAVPSMMASSALSSNPVGGIESPPQADAAANNPQEVTPMDVFSPDKPSSIVVSTDKPTPIPMLIPVTLSISSQPAPSGNVDGLVSPGMMSSPQVPASPISTGSVGSNPSEVLIDNRASPAFTPAINRMNISTAIFASPNTGNMIDTSLPTMFNDKATFPASIPAGSMGDPLSIAKPNKTGGSLFTNSVGNIAAISPTNRFDFVSPQTEHNAMASLPPSTLPGNMQGPSPSSKSNVIDGLNSISPTFKSNVNDNPNSVSLSTQQNVINSPSLASPSSKPNVNDNSNLVSPSLKPNIIVGPNSASPPSKPDVNDNPNSISPSSKPNIINSLQPVSPSFKPNMIDGLNSVSPLIPNTSSIVRVFPPLEFINITKSINQPMQAEVVNPPIPIIINSVRSPAPIPSNKTESPFSIVKTDKFVDPVPTSIPTTGGHLAFSPTPIPAGTMKNPFPAATLAALASFPLASDMKSDHSLVKNDNISRPSSISQVNDVSSAAPTTTSSRITALAPVVPAVRIILPSNISAPPLAIRISGPIIPLQPVQNTNNSLNNVDSGLGSATTNEMTISSGNEISPIMKTKLDMANISLIMPKTISNPDQNEANNVVTSISVGSLSVTAGKTSAITQKTTNGVSGNTTLPPDSAEWATVPNVKGGFHSNSITSFSAAVLSKLPISHPSVALESEVIPQQIRINPIPLDSSPIPSPSNGSPYTGNNPVAPPKAAPYGIAPPLAGVPPQMPYVVPAPYPSYGK